MVCAVTHKSCSGWPSLWSHGQAELIFLKPMFAVAPVARRMANFKFREIGPCIYKGLPLSLSYVNFERI